MPRSPPLSPTLRIVALAGLLGLAGCTALEPLPDARPAAVRAEIRVGDEIEATTAEGRLYQFKVTGIEPAALTGTEHGRPARVRLADIVAVQVARPSVGRTVGRTAGYGLLVFASPVLLVAGVSIVVVSAVYSVLPDAG